MSKWKFKHPKEEPIELILCPFCGYRLNRDTKHKCSNCNHNGFVPNIMLVKEVMNK